MTSEKRLIDADALDKKLEEFKVRYMAQGRKAVAEDYNFVQTVLLTAPTVDAVEVVRCKDCKYLYDGMDDYCCISHRGLARICENSFCSYGERKDNDNN